MAEFDLVLFDLGGVIADMDRELVARLVAETGEDPTPGFRFFRAAYEHGGDDDHPLHLAERGEIDNKTLLERAASTAPAAHLVLGHGGILTRVLRPNQEWGAFVHELTAMGIRVAALTNTFDGLSLEAFEQHRPDLAEHIRTLFGTSVLQSHLVGMRKPNSNMFRYAAEHFDVDPTRVLFIDDEAYNCEGARAVGMTAIQNTDANEARLTARSAVGI